MDEWYTLSDDRKKHARVSRVNLKRLMQLKEVEHQRSVNAVVEHLLDSYEGRPRVSVFYGSVEVWSSVA